MLCSDNIKERGLRGAMRELGFQNVVLLVIEIGLPPLHISGFLLRKESIRIPQLTAVRLT